jgi:hypothetical protein
MYRQTAARLAAELARQYPQLSIDLYQEGTRVDMWFTQIYDPRTKHTWAFASRAAAFEALTELADAPSSSST